MKNCPNCNSTLSTRALSDRYYCRSPTYQMCPLSNFSIEDNKFKTMDVRFLEEKKGVYFALSEFSKLDVYLYNYNKLKLSLNIDPISISEINKIIDYCKTLSNKILESEQLE